MKAKWGALVVEGRNKIAGYVASRNRAGSYFRVKVSPVQPRTSFQLAVRNRLTLLSQGWRGLTTAQRNAWNAAVGDYARTDIFGDLRNPSGFQLYMRLNENLLIIGETALTTPPVPSSVYAPAAASLAVVTGTPAITLTFSPAIPATDQVKVYATAPQSPGKNFVKSEYRLIAVLDNTDTSPAVITADYVARFGSVGATGQKIFVKMVGVNESTGQEGLGLEVSVISTAS